MKKLSHFNKQGRASMVDVSAKPETKRTAEAHAFVRIKHSVLKKLLDNPKGNPLEVARFAGITAAKRTSELIPMCHPLMLSHVDVSCVIESKGVRITSTASILGPTGVEMEALTAVAVAGLTVIDMVKAVEREAVLTDIRVEAKTGGTRGDWSRT